MKIKVIEHQHKCIDCERFHKCIEKCITQDTIANMHYTIGILDGIFLWKDNYVCKDCREATST